MLTRLDRYVLRQLSLALVSITAALVALIWLTQSLKFVELVVNRGLSMRVFMQLTSLLIPGFVAVILPITTFVVVQFIYQRLSGDRELTVMRGAGLSNVALARPAIMLAIMSLAAGLVLNLDIVPASSEAFRRYQFEIRNKIAAFLLQEGVFNPVGEQMTVYVRSRDTDGTLRGILVEDDRDANSRATILAESGRLIAGNGPPHVLLENGSREEIDRKTGRLNVLTFAQDTIDLDSGNKGDDQRYRDVGEMSLHELLYPDPQTVPARDFGKLAVEAHHRLTQPLTSLSFALVALVSVLTGGFQRHGNLVRPALAVGVLVGLLALGLAVSSLATRAMALIPLIWVVAILPGIAAGWLLFAPSTAEQVGARLTMQFRKTGGGRVRV
jgi:lipopolysaccharide export system permease protein